MKTLLYSLLIAFQVWGSVALASGADLRRGNFRGRFCNATANYLIESQDQGTWIFRGHILIESTGQNDPLWIEQYSDNSLRIIRYLQGAESGQTQVVQTHAPQNLRFADGRYYFVFDGAQHYGVGCEDRSMTSRLTMPQP